jgi:hypothetical protein
MPIFDQWDDSMELVGPVALPGCDVASSMARYSRNWARSLRVLSAFAVCSVSFAAPEKSTRVVRAMRKTMQHQINNTQ